MHEPTHWIAVGRQEDIPVRGSRVVATPLGDVALFRTGDDRLFALLDRCPHKGGPLSQGIVHADAVTCPLHGWVIGLADGQARGADKGCARRLPLEQRCGVLHLGLPVPTAHAGATSIAEAAA